MYSQHVTHVNDIDCSFSLCGVGLPFSAGAMGTGRGCGGAGGVELADMSNGMRCMSHFKEVTRWWNGV